MKLVYFDEFRLGALRDDSIVVDVSEVVAGIPHVGPHDLIIGLISDFESYRPALEQAIADGEGIDIATVRLRPPLPRPGCIDCMAVNYMEDGTRSEPAPINAFHKSPTCVIGDGDTMILPDMPATIFEGEAELAVVIGSVADKVSRETALDHIFGYINFIDGSARGVPPFYQMKSRATFAPIGPWLVTRDEIKDPQNLSVRLWNNGEIKQSFNTSDMAHDIARCIEWVSSIHTLMPGDILATGTNHQGLHAFQDGDKIELEVEGLGRLHVKVRDELKRTWPRHTRKEHHEQGLKGVPRQTGGKYAE